MENMPWPKTLGCPAAWAATSSWCIGLKSPEAPAYLTRSVRVSLCDDHRSLVTHLHVVEEQLLLTHRLDLPSNSLVQHSRNPTSRIATTLRRRTGGASGRSTTCSRRGCPRTTTEARIIMKFCPCSAQSVDHQDEVHDVQEDPGEGRDRGQEAQDQAQADGQLAQHDHVGHGLRARHHHGVEALLHERPLVLLGHRLAPADAGAPLEPGRLVLVPEALEPPQSPGRCAAPPAIRPPSARLSSVSRCVTSFVPDPTRGGSG